MRRCPHCGGSGRKKTRKALSDGATHGVQGLQGHRLGEKMNTTYQSRHTCEAMQFKIAGRQIVTSNIILRWINSLSPDALVSLEIPENGGGRPYLKIRTDDGDAFVYDGAWIISTGNGQFAGMDDEQFQKEYQALAFDYCKACDKATIDRPDTISKSGYTLKDEN